MDSTSWALAVSMSGFGMLRHLAETGGKSRGHVVARVKSSQVTWLLYLWGADGPHKGVVTRNRRHFHVVYEPHFPLHRPLRIADVPEWSKGFDSSSNSASCTGSNPVVRILAPAAFFLLLIFPFSSLFSPLPPSSFSSTRSSLPYLLTLPLVRLLTRGTPFPLSYLLVLPLPMVRLLGTVLFSSYALRSARI